MTTTTAPRPPSSPRTTGAPQPPVMRLPRFAEGGGLTTPQAIADYIRQKAKAYAAAQGAPQYGDVFAQNAIAIAWGESSLGQANGGDGGQARGVYQLYFGPGSADAQGRKRGLTPQQADDPKQNIDASMGELWNGFVQAGKHYDFGKAPRDFFIDMWRNAQHPSEQALATHGAQIANVALRIGKGVDPVPRSGTGNGGATAVGGATVAGTTPAAGPKPPGTTPADPTAGLDLDAVKLHDAQQAQVAALQAQKDNILKQMATASHTPGPAGPDGKPSPSQYDQLNAQLFNVDYTYNQAVNQLVQIKKDLGIVKTTTTPYEQGQLAQGQQQLGINQQKANTDQQNANTGTWASFQKNAIDDYTARVAQIHTAFGDDVAAKTLALDLAKEVFSQNFQSVQAKVLTGRLSLDSATQVYQAQAAQQNAENMRFLAGLSAMKVISEQNLALAHALLPAGTQYQPGFAPDDPMNQMLRSRGFNAQVIGVAPVDMSKLDPEQILARQDTAQAAQGYTRPNLNVAGVQSVADANKAISTSGMVPLTVAEFEQKYGALPKNAPDYPTAPNTAGGPPLPAYGSNVTTIENPQAAALPVQNAANTPVAPPATATPAANRDLNGVQQAAPATPANVVFNPATNSLRPPTPANTTTANSFTGGNPNVPAVGWRVDPATGKIVATTAAATAPAGQSWISDPTDPASEINTATGDKRRKAGA